MSLHTLCHEGTHKASSHATFLLNSHGGRAATGKKKYCLCAQGHFSHVQLFATLWTVTGQASLLGVSPILKSTGQYWLPYPSRVLYFLLP